MLEIRDKNASAPEARKQDISSWQEASITRLNSKAKKRFSKNKSAIIAYFTGDKPVREIADEYNLSTEQLLKMATNCLKQHEDGSLWGYRALLPGIVVRDYSLNSAPGQSEVGDATNDNAPSSPELQNQEQSSNGDDNLESTAKRPIVTTAPSNTVEDAVEDVPSIGSVETNSIDHLQDQDSVSVPMPVAELATSAAGIEIPVTETADASNEAEVPAAETDTTANESEVLAAETDITDNEPELLTTETEVISNEATSENVEAEPLSLESEDQITQDEITHADTASSQQPELLSSASQEVLIPEDIPAKPMAIEEQEDQTAEDVGELEIQSVAIINEDQVQPLQRAKITAPLLYEETINSSPIDIYLLPKYVKHTTRTTIVHMAQRRRFVRKRWLRDSQDKTKRQRIYRTVSIAMVSIILLSLLLPIGVGLAAYNVYNNVHGLAIDGVNHLMTVKALIPTSKNDITSVLNASKLQEAQIQLKDAEVDFIQLQQLANRPDIQSLIQQVAPQYAGDLSMAKHLLQVALDVSRMGQELTGVGVIAANIVHSSPLATNAAKPLISVADVSDIKGAITHALYYMDDIQQNMSQVQLSSLTMISAKQKAQLTGVLTQLPSIRNLIMQNQNMVDLVTWLLGVGQPRRFLVQTMDTGELRPGGGFTGQYGVLSINNGRITPFSLHDAGDFDYNTNGMNRDRPAPPQYSWMNFGNWGLRDSNLSADYPTTAQINMQVFQEQGGGPVDGVIDITPAFIGHIIDATGSIKVPQFNETITSSNLEDKLHYYQQDGNAIREQQVKTNNPKASARKAFTTLLGKLLLSRVSHLPTTKLIVLVKNAIKDIQSRDLEIYFTNPAAEQWLVTNGYSGGMSTFSKQDGFMVVQANISISKASEYVHTTEQDNITLDAQGGATHNLAITLDYNRAGRDVYGNITYSDYMRVYTAKSSQFVSGDGFDTGQPLCTVMPSTNKKGNSNSNTNTPPVVSSCNSLPPSQTLNCPSGDYSLGIRGYNMPKTADVMGAPTATTSDLPGRGMFGGMTVTPSDCISTIMLSWYVPNAVKHSGKNLVYPLLVQKQGGLIPTLQINVDASAIKGMKSFSFQGALHADRVFNIR